MSYAEPFVCDVDNTSPSHQRTFNFAGYTGQFASERHNAADDDVNHLNVLKIAHTVVGKGLATRDRHLVRFEAESDDGDGNIGLTAPAVVYAVLDIPRYNITAGASLALVRQLVGFLRTANADDTAPDYATDSNYKKLVNQEC